MLQSRFEAEWEAEFSVRDAADIRNGAAGSHNIPMSSRQTQGIFD
jgi:hypothetical protein